MQPCKYLARHPYRNHLHSLGQRVAAQYRSDHISAVDLQILQCLPEPLGPLGCQRKLDFDAELALDDQIELGAGCGAIETLIIVFWS